MATSNSSRNRQNGSSGYEASRRSRHVSRALNRLIEGRVNGRDAALGGVTCRQVGDSVTVAVGHVPGGEEEAGARAAELAEALRGQGYTLRTNERAPHMLHVTGHGGWVA